MYELVISGGTIVTADAKHRVIDDGVVAVAGDTIAAILTKEQAVQHNLTARERMNADNMIVMPALINSHCHLAERLFRGSGASVSLEARRSAGRIPLSPPKIICKILCSTVACVMSNYSNFFEREVVMTSNFIYKD